MGRSRRRGVEVAGLSITVDLPASLDCAERFAEPVGAVAGLSAGVVQLSARIGAAPDQRTAGFRYETPSHELVVEERAEGWTVVIHQRGTFERWVSLDRGLRVGEVIVSPRAAQRGVCPIAHPLDELLALHRHTRSGGLLLRGRVVGCGREGLLVTSPASCRTPEPTSDRSLVLVRPWRDTFWVQAWPWSGPEAASRGRWVRLSAVHTTAVGEGTPVRPLDRDAAAAALLEKVVVPFHDASFPSSVFESAAALVRAVPVVQFQILRSRRESVRDQGHFPDPMLSMPFGR